jgi:hypothetical protein
MWDGFKKNEAKKRKIKKILPRVSHPSTRGRDPSPSARMRHSGKRLASPSSRVRHSGKRFASPSARVRHSGKSVLKISLFPHIVFCSRVPLLPECCTRGRGSSRSASLPRVPWTIRRVQHSGNSFFPECPIFGTRGSPEHSGNFHSPVVLCACTCNCCVVPNLKNSMRRFGIILMACLVKRKEDSAYLNLIFVEHIYD